MEKDEEKVSLKAKNPHYSGTMFGYTFVNGAVAGVPKKDAEYMAENFGVEVVEAEKPKAKPAPKRTPRKKAGDE